MGIRSLTTFINSNPNFYELYELHGGYLVIDGFSLAPELFDSHSAFGGDHDRYAQVVGNFFMALLKCDIKPLVIFDGGMESRKMKTIYDRKKKGLMVAARYASNPFQRTGLLPMASMIVLKTVLRQKGIKLASTVLEADPDIAGVAKALNCPVLSLDSDFYIFGSMYIPFNTLERVVKSSQGNGYAIRCKLFKPENLLKTFPGLDSSVLPLVAVFLGNDYVDSKTFKHFFDFSKSSNQNQHFQRQRKIYLIFQWLKNYNLNDAVGAILSKLPKKHMQKVLDIIELVVNSYLILPCDMLVPLGFTQEYKTAMNAKGHQKKFKFQENIITLETKKLWLNHEIAATEYLSLVEEPEKEESDLKPDIQNESNEWNNKFANTWPSWFAYHYSIADFPPYFEEMMRLRVFTVPLQIEDFQYPSACTISLKIVRVIDGLLVAGREESAVCLSIIIRDGLKLVRRRVDTVHGTESTRFPALNDLRDTPIAIRTYIFDDALEISDKRNLIKEIPAEWRVYVAAIVYWMRQPDEVLRNSRHLHAMLFTMLLGVVDRKIGYHRDLYLFKELHRIALLKIKSQRNSNTFRTDTRSVSIIEALKAVTENDCLAVAPIFMSKCMVDPQLLISPRDFNVTVVHAFSQFQSCLKYSIHLNALLGCPYEYPIIANLFNGTVLYNLYIEFEKCFDVEAYITELLKEAPGLLHLLNLLAAKVKMFFYKEEHRMKTNEILGESDEYDEYSTTDDEINQYLTPKLKKLLNMDFADNNKGRGVTKRKYKKKKWAQLFDYSVAEDSVFFEKSTKCGRIPKSCFHFRRNNIIHSTDDM